MNTPSVHTIRVWDLPTRLFHWLLVASVIGAFISVKIGGNAMIWHSRFGYAVLTLMMFRLVWGFMGPTHARFLSFIKGPAAIWAQWRGRYPETAGHNPLGALSVIALVVFFGAQSIMGLFTTDEIAFDGPLVKTASSTVIELATRLHNQAENILIALVALHVGAIVYYRLVKKKSLVPAMITGDKALSFQAPASADNWQVRLKALVVLALAALVVYYLSL